MRGDLFTGTRTPLPPVGLKERALRAARAAAQEAPEPGRPRWGFRLLDLAWAAALLVLVACNVWLTISTREATTPTARRSAPASLEERALRAEAEPELLGLGMKLEAGSARPEPALTLSQALRTGS